MSRYNVMQKEIETHRYDAPPPPTPPSPASRAVPVSQALSDMDLLLQDMGGGAAPTALSTAVLGRCKTFLSTLLAQTVDNDVMVATVKCSIRACSVLKSLAGLIKLQHQVRPRVALNCLYRSAPQQHAPIHLDLRGATLALRQSSYSAPCARLSGHQRPQAGCGQRGGDTGERRG